MILCNNKVPDNPADRLNRPRGSRNGHGPEELQGFIGTVAPVFMNLLVKCPIILTKTDEDMECHLSCSNHWMKSQGIAEHVKCGSVT